MLRGDEGRGRLRKAAVSCQQALQPRISEWGNPTERLSQIEYIDLRSEPRELKYLSTWRKRNQLRFRK